MFFNPTMNFYYWKEGEKVVVQNAVMGMMGQKHTHTQKGFRDWIKRSNIPQENLIDLDNKER